MLEFALILAEEHDEPYVVCFDKWMRYTDDSDHILFVFLLIDAALNQSIVENRRSIDHIDTCFLYWLLFFY
jgi:hypothetical protein